MMDCPLSLKWTRTVARQPRHIMQEHTWPVNSEVVSDLIGAVCLVAPGQVRGKFCTSPSVLHVQFWIPQLDLPFDLARDNTKSVGFLGLYVLDLAHFTSGRGYP
ncbi:hypothetical protein HRR83_004273 [Exophiala dermatitidis]|nr:hypothetical protein HRR73_006264 [Exophiala dermatitidis]KAJ4521422.1 hypothetical protein HRR74_003245 [Exophiala dermatitidis]KAJ4574444.1 hypothetical protein HRR81_004348 [Exophiala dermatitidis]KAJ4598126.1 hypothetical protein HRR83_004273 [Exophiala dermatitidis]KAJ4632660.1 hypothetical protein HRR86_001806 [Exophiala dermatitidis]